MFSGSFAKKNNWVRPRGEAFGMNTKGEPAYYKDQVKGKKFKLPDSYSEKVARDRGAEHQKSSSHISSKQRTLPEAPEAPSAVRRRIKTTAKTSRTDPKRDYHAPPTQSSSNKARNKRKSNVVSTISTTQEHILKEFSAPPSRKASSVVSSRASSSRSRSTASHLPDDVEHDSRSRSSRAPSEFNDRHSSSRYRSEHRDRSRASSAYQHEEEDEGFEEEDFDEEDSYIYDEVHPDDSVTFVGQARMNDSHLHPYTQSDRKGFAKYVPHKRSSFTQKEKQASYKTKSFVPAWAPEERKVDAARSVL
jgi:hypothetical protein